MKLAKNGEAIISEEQLRRVIPFPDGREVAIQKRLTVLDQQAQDFIQRSPFCLIGTVSDTGTCDVSPRGDAAGFVRVMDEKTFLIPDRSGNRRLDSLQNILQTSCIGLLFLIPGIDETLRVNGQACIIHKTPVLEQMSAQGKVPLLAIEVDVEECFVHCVKAFRRSKLWEPESWFVTAQPATPSCTV